MGEIPKRVRDDAIAVFDESAVNGVVLDLVADTLSDQLLDPSEPARRLCFIGQGRMAEVVVRESRCLTLDVRLSPEEPAHIEVRTTDDHGRVATQRGEGRRFTHVPPGLTSVHIRWTDVERVIARTASVRL